MESIFNSNVSTSTSMFHLAQSPDPPLFRVRLKDCNLFGKHFQRVLNIAFPHIVSICQSICHLTSHNDQSFIKDATCIITILKKCTVHLFQAKN